MPAILFIAHSTLKHSICYKVLSTKVINRQNRIKHRIEYHSEQFFRVQKHVTLSSHNMFDVLPIVYFSISYTMDVYDWNKDYIAYFHVFYLASIPKLLMLKLIWLLKFNASWRPLVSDAGINIVCINAYGFRICRIL